MAIEKNYPGMANVKLDDVWIYGLDVSNPSVQISGSNLDTTKFTYNSQVDNVLHSLLKLKFEISHTFLFLDKGFKNEQT